MAWRIATGPVMAPGYVRCHLKILRAEVERSAWDGSLLACVDLITPWQRALERSREWRAAVVAAVVKVMPRDAPHPSRTRDRGRGAAHVAVLLETAAGRARHERTVTLAVRAAWDALAAAGPAPACMTCTPELDHPPLRGRKRGRPRAKGAKIGTPAQLAAATPGHGLPPGWPPPALPHVLAVQISCRESLVASARWVRR